MRRLSLLVLQILLLQQFLVVLRLSLSLLVLRHLLLLPSLVVLRVWLSLLVLLVLLLLPSLVLPHAWLSLLVVRVLLFLQSLVVLRVSLLPPPFVMECTSRLWPVVLRLRISLFWPLSRKFNVWSSFFALRVSFFGSLLFVVRASLF